MAQWCDIKDTKYGDRLSKQLGTKNAKEFGMGIDTTRFQDWFGNGKTIKTETGKVVPFVNPIMQVINEKGKSFNLLERFKFQSVDDVRNFFATNYTPGIRRWNSGEDTFFISKDDNRFINVKLLEEIDRIYPGLIEKTPNGELFSTTQDYNVSSQESAAAKPTWFFTLNDKYNFVQKRMFENISDIDNDVDDNVIEMQQHYPKLKILLDKLSIRFNISYQFEQEPDADYKGMYERYEDGTKFIKINIAKAPTIATAFHEYLHPFVEVLKQENPALYTELAKELATTKEGIAAINHVTQGGGYSDINDEDKVEEAIVTYLGELAQAKYYGVHESKSTYSRFVKWLQTLLRKIGIDVGVNLNLNSSLSSITDAIVDDLYTADLSGAIRNAGSLIKYQKVDTDITYTDIFDRIKDKIAILNATVRTRKQGDQFKDDIAGLNELLKNADEITSINNFVANSLQYVDSAYNRFDSLRAAVKNSEALTKEDVSYNLYILGEIQQLLNVYEALSDIHLLYVKEGRKHNDETMQKLAEAIAKHDLMVADFKPFALTWLTEWLYPYTDITNKQLITQGYKDQVLSKEQFRDRLSVALRDISAAGYWLGASINSEDPVSAALGLALKDVVYQNHIKDISTKNKLEGEYKKERGSALYTTKKDETDFNMQFLKEVDNYEKVGVDEETGKPKYDFVKRLAFHTEFNDDEFQKDRIRFFQNAGDKPLRNDKVNYNKWQAARSKFYSGATQVNPNAKDVIDQKRASLSKRQFEKWLINNTHEIDNEQYESGYRTSDFFEGKIYSKNDARGTFRIYSGELIKPAEKYRNKDFKRMMEQPYYRALYKAYTDSNDKLGSYGLRFGIVPQLSKGKNMLSSLKWEKGIKQNAIDLAKAPVRSLYADYDSSTTVQRQDGSEVKHIPIKHINMLDVEDLDTDLLKSVLKFSQMANNYEGMAEIEPNVLVLKTILNGDFNLGIQGRQIAKTNSKGKQVFNAITKKVVPKLAKEDMLNTRLTEFIDDVFYGDSEVKASMDILGREISLNKLGDKVGFFTSLSTMALNLTGGINNVIVGNFNAAIEAIGGRFWSKKDYGWANIQYWKHMPGTIGELVGREKSLLGHLAEHYDIPQGEFRNEFGQDVSGGTANKLMKTSSLFFIQQGGEHQIQLTGLLALMKATKVQKKDGTETDLYHAWKEQGESFGIDGAVNWTAEQDDAFRNRLHAISKNLNGVYNKFDKSVLQRRWMGKLALMFRKYMFTAFKSRYGRQYVDYELGTVQEGYWNLFVKKMYTEMKDYKFGMLQRLWTKEGYNESEKAAINRTLFEMTVIIGAMVLAGVAGNDDKDDWLAAETALQLTRMSSDITQYINPSDFLRVVRNPAASVNLMEKWLSWGRQLFSPFDEYQRSQGIAEKGDNKLYIKTLKVMPLTRQIVNVLTPNEQRKFYQLTGK